MPKSLVLLFIYAASCLGADGPLLLQKPTVNKTHIVFSYAGDLWSVSREGGQAVRLTAGPGLETSPTFSPDGSLIAFQGEYDGNTDVYLMAASGGLPKRLTYHPGADVPVGWTRDGKQVLFRSDAKSYSAPARLFTVSVDGGFPSEIDLPAAEFGDFSPDGRKLAYMPLAPATVSWKRYRGGRTTPIWIANLADASIQKLPRENSNDFNPMWVGNTIYFLSDRNGPVTLFGYDTRSKAVTQLIANDGYDLKAASAGPDAIVYEQFGDIHLFDLKSHQQRRVDIRVSGDIPQVRPTFLKVADKIVDAHLSPSGLRAVFEAHGEILTVPAEKGDVRVLTNTPGVSERSPAWSPDGLRIAYFSDESGEYQLHLRGQNGMGPVQKIDLGKPAFYYQPTWSPDSKSIAYRDSNLQLWYVPVGNGRPVKIDQDTYDTPFRELNPAWSPDSRWIAYTKLLKNHLRALFVYSLQTGKSSQISDGMSDAEYANFDKNGKYLYFTASTNLGLTTAWLDMSSDEHPVSRSVYMAVLNKDEPSPLAPESDEESTKPATPAPSDKKVLGDDAGVQQPATDEKPDGAAAAKPGEEPAAAKGKPVAVKIDLENIGQRIIALPIPDRDYEGMFAGKTGILFLLERVRNAASAPGMGGATVYKFDLKTRKTDKLLDGVGAFDVSFNSEKMLYRQGRNWIIASTTTPLKPGEGVLKLDSAEVRVDPREEWKQMYREVWRIERDFFYDPSLHGVNLADAQKKYEKYLDNLSSRADLTYLLQDMLGELSVGHLRTGGGTLPDVKRVQGGLLGADYRIENGRYRFEKIFGGENWNPQLKAPLTQPGVNVKQGDYLLAVNGRDLPGSENIYSYFEETAGRSVVLKVGPNADGRDAREVTVVPVPNEFALRNLAWIEENRRKVDKLSGGRLAYVYLPNTAAGGFTNFNRYYFAQVGKQGAVIDERFNGGGQIADYVIDNLKRTQTNFFMTRAGEPFTTPQNAIFGPKAMIINEYAGSGGDAMPWLFRDQHVGVLVGKRTWGGLVGIFGFPELMDGGFVTAPNLAFYNLKGEWDVENRGVAPAIEVEYDPAAVKAGHDPQLEKAVEVLMAELKKTPAPVYKRPDFPNYHKGGGAAPTGTR
ncbi:MAG: PDZ domain-containing protein [Acidobacteriota bacterium]|nr:PDZ domain-containing protein [Acidobacteriota bacterium]